MTTRQSLEKWCRETGATWTPEQVALSDELWQAWVRWLKKQPLFPEDRVERAREVAAARKLVVDAGGQEFLTALDEAQK